MKTLPMEQRIAELRAEIDALIDAEVAALKKINLEVPAGFLRQELTRGVACQCATYLNMQERAK